ncbi:hypothetical protein B5F10_11665 [Anaerotruncus colihominis]|uniref:Uncharacterized protein n=1 Tax=Anaerotruncus colihominis TaxID=169435 RepID=A0A1Y4MXA3_9FIRM|nr:hypothetical protein B5F11_07690 [Anaerotruncus colihominis]OUP73318.1 hypothetical protein B5F10_11665 [Anaerotruncus colihominis]
MQETRQPRGVCHASCRCKAPRLNRCLAACGPRFYEGCGPGIRALPSEKDKTRKGPCPSPSPAAF